MLKNITKIIPNAIFDEEMKKHTSFRIGGKADCFVSVSNIEELKNAISFCRKSSVPFMVMGNGSNLLVSDDGIRGVVIQISKNFSNCTIQGNTVVASAGILLSKLASNILNASLTGFEALSGIPGTLGGAIFMNAGAYGTEIKDVVKSIEYINKDGEIKTMTVEDAQLSYRHSIFQENEGIIIGATLELKEGEHNQIKQEMSEYKKRRNEKQPIEMPSAGSTFKRPQGYFAGKLIQDCNLMGFSIGGAQVSKKHAGFVVNTGGATAKDVVALIEHVQNTVFEKFGVMLEPEVKITK